MQQELLDTIRRLDRSALFITHDLVEASLIGDRIIVMGRHAAGVLLAVTSPFGKDRDLEQVRITPEFVPLERHLRDASRVACSWPRTTPAPPSATKTATPPGR